jgi:hypothetical protein
MGRATIFHKAQDYFGLRLFQTFQTPALSSIERFNRCAPFKALRRFKVQGSRVQRELPRFENSRNVEIPQVGEATIVILYPATSGTSLINAVVGSNRFSRFIASLRSRHLRR